MTAVESPRDALDLDAIRRREQAATPAPWTAHPDGLVWSTLIGDPVSGSVLVVDAEFIAAARTAVPALLAEVDRLRAEQRADHGIFTRAINDAERERDEYRDEAITATTELANARAEVDRLRAAERHQGRAALTEYRDANHRHNDRAPGWCICGDDWDDEGCTEYIGLTEAAQLFGAVAR
ncbi:hypothetical protein ACH4T9_12330 [Micromonospora sp. NPDC020750]|uniref:hypothetical protein n=1 Tax=unclassified Micromonospora TaxID=2617518 RepID=UPI00379B066E